MTAAWTRSEGKSPSGGLNAKGRASYHSETGGTLKTPTKDTHNSRHHSFCARMSGMRAKMTNHNNAHDPESRINKALRKWGC
jgi:hypothetical protein